MENHDEKTIVRPNLENLPFTEYYNRLKDEPKEGENNPFTPLDEFLIVAAKQTGKHPGSIRRWAYGTAIPNFLEKKAMGELLQCSPEILFPKEDATVSEHENAQLV